jgi:hypothetical protein
MAAYNLSEGVVVAGIRDGNQFGVRIHGSSATLRTSLSVYWHAGCQALQILENATASR